MICDVSSLTCIITSQTKMPESGCPVCSCPVCPSCKDRAYEFKMHAFKTCMGFVGILVLVLAYWAIKRTLVALWVIFYPTTKNTTEADVVLRGCLLRGIDEVSQLA